MKYVFVLGASDPEMEEVERVVKAAGHHVRYACLGPVRVRAESAQMASGLNLPLPKDATVVCVECHVHLLQADVYVDHHAPGDPGYACSAAEYLQGSSLGQVLSLLGLEPTQEQRIIAAADHCPNQAYRGLCPGVTAQQMAEWRTRTRAQRRGVSIEEMEAAIEAGRKHLLTEAPRVPFLGKQFPWVTSRAQLELAEASARYDIPFMYAEQTPSGRTKAGLMGAEPAEIEAWMAQCGLQDVYGNPHRGYAGGYL